MRRYQCFSSLNVLFLLAKCSKANYLLARAHISFLKIQPADWLAKKERKKRSERGGKITNLRDVVVVSGVNHFEIVVRYNDPRANELLRWILFWEITKTITRSSILNRSENNNYHKFLKFCITSSPSELKNKKENNKLFNCNRRDLVCSCEISSRKIFRVNTRFTERLLRKRHEATRGVELWIPAARQ